MTNDEVKEELRRLSRALVASYPGAAKGSKNSLAAGRAALIEITRLTLEKGSLRRLNRERPSSEIDPSMRDLYRKRSHAVDVLDAWRRVDTAKSKGIDAGGIVIPDRGEAEVAYKNARNKIGTIERKSGPTGAPKAGRIGWARTPNAQLLAEARSAKGPERDEIWREAKRRKWSRRQLREAFDPVMK